MRLRCNSQQLWTSRWYPLRQRAQPTKDTSSWLTTRSVFAKKLHSRWTGPYTVKEVFPYGTVAIENADGVIFKVNGHRLNVYVGGPIESVVEVIELHTPHTV